MGPCSRLMPQPQLSQFLVVGTRLLAHMFIPTFRGDGERNLILFPNVDAAARPLWYWIGHALIDHRGRRIVGLHRAEDRRIEHFPAGLAVHPFGPVLHLAVGMFLA